MATSLMKTVGRLATFGAADLKSPGCSGGSNHVAENGVSDNRCEYRRANDGRARLGVVINAAREKNLGSVALAQAFQFDCGLRQRDVIGEWGPIEDPGDETKNQHLEEKRGRGFRRTNEDHLLRHPEPHNKEEFCSLLRSTFLFWPSYDDDTACHPNLIVISFRPMALSSQWRRGDPSTLLFTSLPYAGGWAATIPIHRRRVGKKPYVASSLQSKTGHPLSLTKPDPRHGKGPVP